MNPSARLPHLSLSPAWYPNAILSFLGAQVLTSLSRTGIITPREHFSTPLSCFIFLHGTYYHLKIYILLFNLSVSPYKTLMRNVCLPVGCFVLVPKNTQQHYTQVPGMQTVVSECYFPKQDQGSLEEWLFPDLRRNCVR